MKSKIEKKVAKAKTKAKAKVVRKCGKGAKCAAVAGALALAALMAGCSTAESQQPAKANTMSNTFDDCIVIIAAKARIPKSGTNAVIEVEGGEMPCVEMFTQTQSLESSGTESFAQGNTQTPTTDVKPDLDVHYNDAVGKGGDAAKGLLETLTSESAATLREYIAQKKSGVVTVTAKDGTTQQVECKDGVCNPCPGGVCDPSPSSASAK